MNLSHFCILFPNFFKSNEQIYRVYHENDKKFDEKRIKWTKQDYLSKISRLTLTKRCKFTSFRNVFHWRHETQYSPQFVP